MSTPGLCCYRPWFENDDKLVTGGDVAPEGLAFVSDSVSPTGKPLLLAACEVSGTLDSVTS